MHLNRYTYEKMACDNTMTHKERDRKYPKCFGDLETVFPKGEGGLRNSPEACQSCLDKTACLRSAMESKGGMKVREEIVDRAYHAGAMSFLERWSQKKGIRRRLREKKNRHQEEGHENY